MPTISTNDLKNGTVLDIDGQLWQVIWFQHHKPGKGNTVVRSKLKNVLSGKIVDKTFNSDTKVESATVDRREMQYLYRDGSDYVFMDTETYEQPVLSAAQIGDNARWLKENLEVTVDYYQDRPLKVTVPNVVEMKIVRTDPGVKGDTVSGGSKPAELESGASVNIPLM